MKKVISILDSAIKSIFPSIDHKVNVVPCVDLKYGDYQSSDAISLFQKIKALSLNNGKYKSPYELGLEIKSNIPENSIIGQVEIAKNGYINFFLSSKYLCYMVLSIIKNGPICPYQDKKKIIVDFSSPNICKEMHVGHLRSTIIGDSICRILEFCGHEVQRISHIGDFGTQFGMLIAYMKLLDKNESYKISDLTSSSVGSLQEFYKAAKQRFDSDEDFKRLSHQEVVTLQSGDPINVKLWKELCNISMEAFNKIYKCLDIKLEVKGESFYKDKISPLIDELEKSKIIETNQGAKCIFISGYDKTPLIVQKSDGGFSYDSTDLAAMHYRLIEEKADWVIYVVDVFILNYYLKQQKK